MNTCVVSDDAFKWIERFTIHDHVKFARTGYPEAKIDRQHGCGREPDFGFTESSRVVQCGAHRVQQCLGTLFCACFFS